MRPGPIDFDTRATRCDPLYVLPVGLVAVELGWRWGLGAAALAFALYVAWSLLADVDLSALGYATRALVLFALGGVLGQLAARARATGGGVGALVFHGDRPARHLEPRRVLHAPEPGARADAAGRARS